MYIEQLFILPDLVLVLSTYLQIERFDLWHTLTKDSWVSCMGTPVSCLSELAVVEKLVASTGSTSSMVFELVRLRIITSSLVSIFTYNSPVILVLAVYPRSGTNCMTTPNHWAFIECITYHTEKAKSNKKT